ANAKQRVLVGRAIHVAGRLVVGYREEGAARWEHKRLDGDGARIVYAAVAAGVGAGDDDSMLARIQAMAQAHGKETRRGAAGLQAGLDIGQTGEAKIAVIHGARFDDLPIYLNLEGGDVGQLEAEGRAQGLLRLRRAVELAGLALGVDSGRVEDSHTDGDAQQRGVGIQNAEAVFGIRQRAQPESLPPGLALQRGDGVLGG